MDNLEKKIIEQIKEMSLLSSEEISRVEFLMKKEKKSLADILVENDLMNEEHISRVTAEVLGIPFVQLNRQKISEDVLRIIPEVVARKQLIISFDKSKEGIKIAMNNPTNLEIIELIKKKTGEKVIPCIASKKDIKWALGLYIKKVKEDFKDIIQKNIKQVNILREDASEAPIIKIVNTILEYGYQNRASDVHIEPSKDYTLIRFRIDGILHDIIKIPSELHNLIVMRIKILAKMRTDEHRMAQDGKLSHEIGDETMDVRVSVIPITRGEKIVMRLLLEEVGRYTLEDLGFLNADLQKVKTAINKPWGMILATGPTGCGKTTTLYSILEILNKREINISTIEDPVEYDISGVNQIQVNPKTNLTFASGLRALLRQDPNIIMVGEIRDEDTAKIAVNSAMTGHLVLSTLHTNDAATTLPRLLQMGAQPFLVASTINIAIAQRLVRKICPQCIASKKLDEKTLDLIKKQLSPEIIKKFNLDKKNVRIYYGQGCDLCQHTGYKGRIGIFEILQMTEAIKELVINQANSDQIKTKAIEEGMRTMTEDGLEKVLKGITTIDEVLRVTKE